MRTMPDIKLETPEIAFTKQSIHFDKNEIESQILPYYREIVRKHIIKLISTNSKILEINAGTGVDAVYFAQKGYQIHATDISHGMISQLEEKSKSLNLNDKISFEVLSFEKLEALKPQKFDLIFSNFSGLNCTDNLSSIFKNFSDLLNPNGLIVLVVMPKICLWEISYLFRGNFKLGLRRLKKGDVIGHLEGIYFKTYYHPLQKVRTAMPEDISFIQSKGLGVFLPQPHMKNFPPFLLPFMRKLENIFSGIFPFNRWADLLILTFQKTK